MTIYAPSDFCSVTVPADDEHLGCGQVHVRPEVDGHPVHPWGLTCPDGRCEDWLLAHDVRWTKTVAEILPTFDEKKSQERLAIEGPKQQAALLTAALARLSGLGNQIPPSLQRQMEGLKAHIPLPGQLVCRECSTASPAGQRFCGACGAGLSAPVAAAAIKSGPAA